VLRIFQKISPVWSLRLGIGITYLVSGTDLILRPSAWHWALPYWLRQIITAVVPLNTYLGLQGAVELVMAICLLVWFMKPEIIRWVAFISTLEFTAILVLAFIPYSETNFLITFRDVGLLGAALTLYRLLLKENGY